MRTNENQAAIEAINGELRAVRNNIGGLESSLKKALAEASNNLERIEGLRKKEESLLRSISNLRQFEPVDVGLPA